jgi:hypothetical protein
MTAQTILPANTLSGAFEVANSARFEANTSMTKSASSGNTRTFTISFWCKRAALGAVASGSNQFPISFYEDSSNRISVAFLTANTFIVYAEVGGSTKMNLTTNRVFGDTSAWYHVVIKIDTTQGTEANRAKLYINGVQETSFSTATYPSQNDDLKINTNIYIGTYDTSNNFYHGYLAEVVFIDGTALDQTSFGEFDEDSPTIWKPKNVSGLTFGTNGFYLDFEDSANLGNDANGGTDLSETNLAATDQSTDTCTNNFATLNPINNFFPQATLSNGNLDITTNNSNECFNTSTIGVSSGKWYMEVKIVTTTASIRFYSGVTYRNPDATSDWLGNNFYSWGYRSQDGKLYNEASLVYTGATLADGDIVGIAMDLDNHKLYTHKAGTYNNSGDPTSGATGTGAAALDSGETYFFAVGDTGAVAAGSVNFGSPSFAISSGNADANGHGNFEYAVPSGYFALCTKNLAEHG